MTLVVCVYEAKYQWWDGTQRKRMKERQSRVRWGGDSVCTEIEVEIQVQICIIIFEPWPGEYICVDLIFQEGNNERCKYLITKKTSSNLVPTIQRRTSSHKHNGLVLVKRGLVWKYHKCIVDMDIYIPLELWMGSLTLSTSVTRW